MLSSKECLPMKAGRVPIGRDAAAQDAGGARARWEAPAGGGSGAGSPEGLSAAGRSHGARATRPGAAAGGAGEPPSVPAASSTVSRVAEGTRAVAAPLRPAAGRAAGPRRSAPAVAVPEPRSRLNRIRSAPNGPLPARTCALLGTFFSPDAPTDMGAAAAKGSRPEIANRDSVRKSLSSPPSRPA
jgi:hypothetical protein